MNITVLESILKATLVIGLGALLVSRLRHQAASLRHLVWITSLAGALLIPVLTPFVPANRLAVLPPEKLDAVRDPTAVMPGDAKVNPARPNSTPVATNDSPLSALTLLLTLWLAGGLVVSGRYLAGAVAIRRIARRDSLPATLSTTQTAQDLGFPSRGALRVCSAEGLPSAMTWGLRRPVILLPGEANQWPQARLEAVLHHEIAHVRRFDFASQLLAELACALYWFNPIVWLGARAMRAEAETAADDAVLRSGVQPSAYAAELLQLAADFGRRRPTLSRVGVPIMVQPKIETRLKSVLAPSARRRGVTTANVLAALVIAACAAPALAGLHAGKQQATGRSEDESREALIRMKQLGIATIMYASDCDDRLPYGNSTAVVAKNIYPYIKNKTILESPGAGGRFLYNLHLSGVLLSTPPAPAETVAWYEQLPNLKDPFAVAYMDGHAKLLKEGNRPAFKKALATKFK